MSWNLPDDVTDAMIDAAAPKDAMCRRCDERRAELQNGLCEHCGIESELAELTDSFTPPKGWEVIDRWGDGWALREREGGLRVLIDWSLKQDEWIWCHVSYSRKSWIPTHEDTYRVKAAFLGDRYAYAVFPPASEYVNLHPNCLHLWARMDKRNGQVLPEFSGEIGGIKSI